METTDTTATAAVPGGRIASRLWVAARTEFSSRGYHGARVQGIAKRAGCNVALLYRHWASKRALYVEILKSIWRDGSKEIGTMLDATGGARGVVAAYLETRLKDPEASQIVIRELLDGGPFLREIIASDPSVILPLKRVIQVLRQGNGHQLRAGVDPEMAALLVAGFSALVGAAHESAQPFFENGAPSSESWKSHVSDLLLHGLEAQ
jgi:TetR/AcrR family transcriptional regulator